MLAPICDCDKWQSQSAVLFWDMDGYDATLRAFFASLATTQWLPRDELEAYQRRQLTHLILHAAATAPFYKDRLAPLLRPDGSVDFTRWGEVPILTRSDLRERQEELWSTDVPERHGHISVSSTSGSTGVPVKMKWAHLSGIARKAAKWRMYDWHGFDYAADFGVTFGSAPWPEGGVDGPWGPPWRRPLGAQLSIISTTPYSRTAEWLGRKRPKYLTGLSMTLPAIAEAMVDRKIDNPLVCMVGYGGQVTAACRKSVSTSLGIPVIEMYSSEECSHIAHECEAGSLHVLSELVLVEILDEEDRPCPPGIEGRIIVTVLHNTAQPTIRYEIGDVAALSPPCRCGRSLPVLSPIAGRIKHMFQFPGRPRLAPSDGRVYGIIAPHLDPSWYQIAQTGPNEVEIRFVSKRVPDEEVFQCIRQEIPIVWRHAEPKITFRQLAAPSTKPGQKHIVFVNEWKPEITPG
jgi:phenylacetate-CoA ligase